MENRRERAIERVFFCLFLPLPAIIFTELFVFVCVC
jgi:hypothetical protein